MGKYTYISSSQWPSWGKCCYLVSCPELSNEVKNFRRKVLTASEAGDRTLLLLCLDQEGSVISEADKSEAFNQTNTEGLTLLQSCAQRGLKHVVR